jgi:hypothetical protein
MKTPSPVALSFFKIPCRNEGRAFAHFTDPASGQAVRIQSPAAPFSKAEFWRTVLADRAVRYMDGKRDGLIPLTGDMLGAPPAGSRELHFAYAG